MANDKSFLTYNQQMKKLRNDKKIDCNGTPHKISLVRSGYFNILTVIKLLLLAALMLMEIILIFQIHP